MNTLAESYAKQLERCKIKPEHAAEVKAEASRIQRNQPRYAALVKEFPGMPWWVPGILHSMECGLNFNQHLHNGDPLRARTVQEPKGRPVEGRPPFAWHDSAADALRYDKLDQVTDWSAGNALVAFENYNGRGYRNRGVPSPYLWSFTDQYVKGKYGSDNVYDPDLVSKQCGCGALMKALAELGVKMT